MDVHCIAGEFIFIFSNILNVGTESIQLQIRHETDPERYSQPFSLSLWIILIDHFNFLKFSTYLSYVMEDSATKRDRRAVGTVTCHCV